MGLGSGWNMPDGCYSTPYDEKTRCEGCNEMFHDCDMVFDEVNDAWYCESCHEELEMEREMEEDEDESNK